MDAQQAVLDLDVDRGQVFALTVTDDLMHIGSASDIGEITLSLAPLLRTPPADDIVRRQLSLRRNGAHHHQSHHRSGKKGNL